MLAVKYCECILVYFLLVSFQSHVDKCYSLTIIIYNFRTIFIINVVDVYVQYVWIIDDSRFDTSLTLPCVFNNILP